MKRFFLVTSLLAGIVLFGACSEERIIIDNSGGEATISLNFPTSRGSGVPENTLDSLRVIIFKSNDLGTGTGTPITNRIVYPLPPDDDEIEITEIVPVGYLNLYLIANETVDMNLDAITSFSDLQAVILDNAANDFLHPTFPMYSGYKAVRVDALGNVTHPEAIISGGKTTFLIERAISKLDVFIRCKFSDLMPVGGIDNRAITLTSASIISMPLTPYLVQREYIGSNFFSTDDVGSSITITSANLGPRTDGTPGFESDVFTFYLPEHILNKSDHSHYTYLKLVGQQLPPNSPATLTYRVPLGNGLGLGPNTVAYMLDNYATIPAADLTITRNVYYSLTLDIKGLGERSDIQVIPDIKPWSLEDVDGSNNAPYLNVSTTSTSVSSFYKQRVYFWSNQTDVRLETTGKELTSSGTNFTVNNIFDNVAGTPPPYNFFFNPSTGSGYIDFIILPTATNVQTKYLVYLTASKLRREIELNVDFQSPTQFHGWLYVKQGSSGYGTNWTDAAPTINDALQTWQFIVSEGYTVNGILVAGGDDKIYNEDINFFPGAQVYGGFVGTPGTELTQPTDNPYTALSNPLVRDLVNYRTIVTRPVHIAGDNILITLMDGFRVTGVSGNNNAVSVINFASLNATEIIYNTSSSGYAALFCDNYGTAVNVLLMGNTTPLAIGTDGILMNATVAGNGANTSTCAGGSIYNSVFWGNAGAFNIDNASTVQYNAFPETYAVLGTGHGAYDITNIPIHANNTQWFGGSNVVPGPHFNLDATPTIPYYAAMSNYAPMLGRGDQALFDANTPFMPTANQVCIDGTPRDYMGIDMGCYEDTVWIGFRLAWASDRVYISTKTGAINDIPLLLPDNETYNINLNWTVTVDGVLINNTWTLLSSPPTSGSGSGVMVGTVHISTDATYNSGGERQVGTLLYHTSLGTYLPDVIVQVWQIPGTNAVWEDGYAGVFFRNSETSERYITGYNSYAYFTGTQPWLSSQYSASNSTNQKGYYTYWSARIVSGLDWIKVDTNNKGAFGGEVQETFGGMVSGATPATTDYIKFRVGAKSTLPPGAAPRYGLIVVSRGNSPTNAAGAAWLFVRQGEEPDYLYRPNTDGFTHSQGRTQAVKFSAFNLIAPSSSTMVNGGVNVRPSTTSPSTAEFTSHPSKIGDFFQWNNTLAFRRGVQTSALSTYSSSTTWNDNRDVCPPGYRRPTYGELVHSLYQNQSYNGTTSISGGGAETMRGFIWGYLADGYFDQLPTADPVPEGATPANVYHGAVPNVAAKGMLMVNHYNYASVFFPMAGTMGSLTTGVNAVTSAGQSYQIAHTIIDNINIPSLYRGVYGQTGMIHSRSNPTGANTHWVAGHVGLACTSITAGYAALVRCVAN